MTGEEMTGEDEEGGEEGIPGEEEKAEDAGEEEMTGMPSVVKMSELVLDMFDWAPSGTVDPRCMSAF